MVLSVCVCVSELLVQCLDCIYMKLYHLLQKNLIHRACLNASCLFVDVVVVVGSVLLSDGLSELSFTLFGSLFSVALCLYGHCVYKLQSYMSTALSKTLDALNASNTHTHTFKFSHSVPQQVSIVLERTKTIRSPHTISQTRFECDIYSLVFDSYCTT